MLPADQALECSRGTAGFGRRTFTTFDGLVQGELAPLLLRFRKRVGAGGLLNHAGHGTRRAGVKTPCHAA